MAETGGKRPDVFECSPMGGGKGEEFAGPGDMRFPEAGEGDPDKCLGPKGLSLCGCCECGDGPADDGEAIGFRGSFESCKQKLN